ncbi:hypothetical protein G6F40_014469 [Rhizopus arrhizus]|nr:hypothetical protein G6F40_014469 [Rhizopus arrhizus]
MHQHGGQQHQQQRQCPAQHPLPVDPIAVLDRQPVAAQCLVLARCHLQQQAVEGRGQRGMAALHRHHQLIVETRRGSNLQAPLEAAAQQLIDQRQVAHIGIGFAIKNPLHRLFGTTRRHDPGLRCLLQHVATHALRIGQQHALSLQVRQAQQGRAGDAADDHVRHADEGLAEHPVRPEPAPAGAGSRWPGHWAHHPRR